MGARWYDSALGRFISRDPSGSAGSPLNLYTYCNDNPLNSTDPSGMSSVSNIGLNAAYPVQVFGDAVFSTQVVTSGSQLFADPSFAMSFAWSASTVPGIMPFISMLDEKKSGIPARTGSRFFRLEGSIRLRRLESHSRGTQAAEITPGMPLYGPGPYDEDDDNDPNNPAVEPPTAQSPGMPPAIEGKYRFFNGWWWSPGVIWRENPFDPDDPDPDSGWPKQLGNCPEGVVAKDGNGTIWLTVTDSSTQPPTVTMYRWVPPRTKTIEVQDQNGDFHKVDKTIPGYWLGPFAPPGPVA